MDSMSYFEDASKQKWTWECSAEALRIDFGSQSVYTFLQTSHISQSNCFMLFTQH